MQKHITKSMVMNYSSQLSLSSLSLTTTNHQDLESKSKISIDKILIDLKPLKINNEKIIRCFANLEKYRNMYAEALKEKGIDYFEVKNINPFKFVTRLKNDNIYYYLDLNVKLGDGTAKTVKSYYDCQKNTFVALAFINFQPEEEEACLKKIQKEYKISRKFNPILNQSIVKTRFLLKGSNHFVIGAEKCDAPLTKLFTYELPENVKDSVMQQILGILSKLHEAGYAHRDIKEDNILFKVEGDEIVIKIADFGFACKKDWKPKYAWRGSPRYTAPEVGRIKEMGKEEFFSQVDLTKMDMWAAGLVCYRLFKETWPPYFLASKNLKECLDNAFNLTHIPGLNPNDPRENLISKMLEIDPAQRITAAGALEAAKELNS